MMKLNKVFLLVAIVGQACRSSTDDIYDMSCRVATCLVRVATFRSRSLRLRKTTFCSGSHVVTTSTFRRDTTSPVTTFICRHVATYRDMSRHVAT